MKKIIISAMAFVFGIAMSGSVAYANVEFNNDPQDRPTVMIQNHTTNPCGGGPGPTCWRTSVSAKAGDIISVQVYYHNTGDETARDVTIGMNPKSSSSKTTHTFRGGVSAAGYPAEIGSATVTISSSETLTFIPGSVEWSPNQTGPNGRTVPDENALFSSHGLPIGDIAPGWDTQGAVSASFKVSAAKVEEPERDYECSDGKDNDHDGYTDWPKDRGCESKTDDNEYNKEDKEECEIDSFKADDYTIEKGDETRLRWSTTNCTSAKITPDLGSVDVDDSEEVDPTRTTKYILTAYGRNNTDTANLTITVKEKDEPKKYCPQAITNPATLVNTTSAKLNGLVIPNASSADGWFEWGTSTSLGYKTTVKDIGSGSTSIYEVAYNLKPSTVYYYRAVAKNDNCANVYGEIKSFKTLAAAYNPTPRPYVPPRYVAPKPIEKPKTKIICTEVPIESTTNTSSFSGSSAVKVTVESSSDRMCVNKKVAFTVTYKNSSDSTLKNVRLVVTHQNDIEFTDSSEGNYDEDDSELTLSLGTLSPGESGSIEIDGRILSRAKEGSDTAVTATMSFTDAQSGDESDAMGYTTVEITDDCSGLTASAGNTNFLPDTLLEWLLLILVLLGLIALGRQIAKKKEQPA